MSDDDAAAIAAAKMKAKTHGGEDCQAFAVLDDFLRYLDESFAISAMEAFPAAGGGIGGRFVGIGAGGFGSIEAVDAE